MDNNNKTPQRISDNGNVGNVSGSGNVINSGNVGNVINGGNVGSVGKVGNAELPLRRVVGVQAGEHNPVVAVVVIGVDVKPGDGVVVTTSRGLEYGVVTHAPRDNRAVSARQSARQRPYTFVRAATAADLVELEKQRRREKELFSVFGRKIKEYNVPMKPVNVECTLDGAKAMFYFTSEARVDFRGLVKELATFCHSRVELRQVGSRDEAKLLGGIGICGREFCCKSFLTGFQPVSIQMAKKQSMSLNPTKTAGTCGRLMCCLKYEQNVYDELLKIFPKIGSSIETPKGVGIIDEINYISGEMRVRLPGKDAFTHIKRSVSEAGGGVGATVGGGNDAGGGVGKLDNAANRAVRPVNPVSPANPVNSVSPVNSAGFRADNSRFADRRPPQRKPIQKKYPNGGNNS